MSFKEAKKTLNFNSTNSTYTSTTAQLTFTPTQLSPIVTFPNSSSKLIDPTWHFQENFLPTKFTPTPTSIRHRLTKPHFPHHNQKQILKISCSQQAFSLD